MQVVEGGPQVEEPRARRIEPVDPGGEAVCSLTGEGAHGRRAPIDVVLQGAQYWPESSGYTIRLPRGEQQWVLALQFIEEEAACCPAFTFEAAELDDAIVVRATLSGERFA
jgi:hypothetical protein